MSNAERYAPGRRRRHPCRSRRARSFCVAPIDAGRLRDRLIGHSALGVNQTGSSCDRTTMMTTVQQAGPSRPDVERWYRDYRVELTRLAYLALGDNEAAQDAVQEAFVSLHLRAERVRHPKIFLRAAVLNQCRSTIRRTQVRRRVVAMTPVVAGGNPGDTTRLERPAVLQAIRQLPRRQRDVVLLRFYLDMSEAEIAATLRVRPGTVKTSSHRALQALTPLLEDLR